MSLVPWAFSDHFILLDNFSDQRDEELPTLLHFAAKYGLKNLTQLVYVLYLGVELLDFIIILYLGF